MAMTFVMQEAAVRYGLAWAFDDAVLGSATSNVVGDGVTGDPQQLVIDTANGFEMRFSMVFQDDSHAVVNQVTCTAPDGELMWIATGAEAVTPDTFTLEGIFAGDDSLTGNSGANVFAADLGQDTIDGGGGIDHMVYAVASTAAVVTPTGNGVVTVSTASGTDTLVNVERIDFTDESIAFDVNGPAGEAYRLYQAALNRAPDIGGLGYYIHKLENGWSEHDIATGFINSPEFISRFGSAQTLSDLQYVQLLYQNILHRAGEDAGVAYHVQELQTMDRQQVLVNFAESPENRANLVGVMAQGMPYLEPNGPVT